MPPPSGTVSTQIGAAILAAKLNRSHCLLTQVPANQFSSPRKHLCRLQPHHPEKASLRLRTRSEPRDSTENKTSIISLVKVSPTVAMHSALRTAAVRSSFRSVAARAPATPLMTRACFSTTIARRSGGEHAEESFEEFSAR